MVLSLSTAWWAGVSVCALLLLSAIAYLALQPQEGYVQVHLDTRTIPSSPLSPSSNLSFAFVLVNRLGVSQEFTWLVRVDNETVSGPYTLFLQHEQTQRILPTVSIASAGIHKVYVVVSPTGSQRNYSVYFPVHVR